MGFLRVPGLGWGKGGGGGGLHVAYDSRTINDIEMKFGGVVEA